MLTRVYRSKRFGSLIGFAALVFSCSKDNAPAPPPPPIISVQVSIAPITDSLRKQPITFQAIVDRTPDSYKWEFGDGSTSTSASPQHAYNEMGTYDILCTVTLAGVSSYAKYKLPIKADGRINGTRHFSGHYFYTKLDPGVATIIINRDIADTTLTFTWPEPFHIGFSGGPYLALRQDTGNEVWYFAGPPGGGDLKYYPANDSIYIKYVGKGAIPGYVAETWEFWGKK